MLYEIILETSKPEVAAVLKIITKALEHQQPVMFFCKVATGSGWQHAGHADLPSLHLCLGSSTPCKPLCLYNLSLTPTSLFIDATLFQRAPFLTRLARIEQASLQRSS